MSTATVILLILIAVAATALMAIFAGMETGLYTLNRVRLELRTGRGDRHASTLSRLIARPHRMLAVILVGTNAANQLGAWAIATSLHGRGYGPIASIIIDTIILVPVLLIFAEILPKDLFRAHGDRWCYTLAAPLRIVEIAMTAIGLVGLIEWFGRAISSTVGGNRIGELTARQRMSDLFKEGIDAGVLSHGQTALLDRALELRELRVSDVMVPWDKVGTIAESHDDHQAAIDSRWSRLPVMGPNGRVLGIVSVLDLACASIGNLQDTLVQAMILQPSDRADAALRSLRSHQTAMAIVHDREGLPIGIVTVKDLVKPLLG
ncbi:MAG: DUF21 domain-containing protein [Planctomycetes bacterium]|nr:DUF21 domain-containing protein [Planctomycetota bacterium]